MKKLIGIFAILMIATIGIVQAKSLYDSTNNPTNCQRLFDVLKFKFSHPNWLTDVDIDYNEDGRTSLSDIVIFTSKRNNELWCRQQLNLPIQQPIITSEQTICMQACVYEEPCSC